LTKSLKFQGSKLVFKFKQPQGFADNLTGGTVGARGNLFADHLLEARSKTDINWHKVTSKHCNQRIGPMAKIVNLWQELVSTNRLRRRMLITGVEVSLPDGEAQDKVGERWVISACL
jgi:hypothetical protein